MQSIAPLTLEQLLRPVKKILYRLEIWDGAAWLDLSDLSGKNYLQSVSFQLGGAGMSPDPIAARWSASILNPGGIFHPFHPSSPYADLFQIGRVVRISVGGDYDENGHYWRRLTGYIDARSYDNDAQTITLSGLDGMKRLSDTVIRPSKADEEGEVRGPSYWGKLYITDAKDTYTPTGNERYTLEDILDPVNEWEGDPGPPPEEPGDIEAPYGSNGPGWNHGWTRTEFARCYGTEDMELAPNKYYGSYRHSEGFKKGYIEHVALIGMAEGTGYKIKIRCRMTHDQNEYDIEFAQTVGGSRRVLKTHRVNVGSGWEILEEDITAEATSALQIRIIGNFVSSSTDCFDIEYISIYACSEDWYKYPLPEDCNGPYWVELDGEPVMFGDPVARDGTGGGWYWEEATNQFYFDRGKSVKAGIGNLNIWYYTTQNLDDVLADLLVAAGFAPDRETALAGMSYTPTGVTIPRVWFKRREDACITIQAAVKMLCERANYRFWLDEDWVPHFHPAPALGAPVVELPANTTSAGLEDRHDLSEIRNRVVIEGMEQGMFATREEKPEGRITGEAFDQDSIDKHQEKTHPITNHLFQDEESINAMCEALVAEMKDPKLYASVKLPSPLPLERGDTISWDIPLRPASGEDPGLTVTMTGIIRDVEFSGVEFKYKLEVGEAGPLEMHALLSGTHYDTKPAAPSFGALIYADGDPEVPLGSPSEDQHALLNGAVHPDTEEQGPELGAVLLGLGEPVKWQKLEPGGQGRLLEMGPAAPAWGKKIHSSDAPPGPGDGEDGDIWLEY